MTTSDFDRAPPMPVSEYEVTVRRVNVGYELTFTLAHCFLRALERDDLHLLVIGAGGGVEIETFLPAHPGWRMTGVDPSADMLAMAGERAAALGVSDRVTLVRGTVEDLPPGEQFDGATCLYVLHFLPDAAKLALLRGTHQRLRAGAPLVAVSGTRPGETALGREFQGAWQQYGELHGMESQVMASTIERLVGLQQIATTGAGYQALMREAGFSSVAPFLEIFGGALTAWLAR